MSKRKNAAAIDNNDMNSDNESLSDVQVDFDFQSVKPDDVLGIKTLLSQLISSEFSLHEPCQLIVSQTHLGTCVKVDGSDPYALITFLPLSECQKVVEFLSSLSSTTFDKENNWGWFINERLINMPFQIAPPLFRLLHEEMEWAVEDKKYEFSRVAYITRAYREVEGLNSDDDEGNNSMQRKKQKKHFEQTLHWYKEEDELATEYAQEVVEFKLKREHNTDASRVFQENGILPVGLFMTFTADKFREFAERIKAMEAKEE